MQQLKALIFDVDGTLAETEPDGHSVAFNMAFQEVGIDWHWDHETYGELLDVTGGKERLFHYWQRYRPETLAEAEAHELLPRLHQRKNSLYAQIVADGKIPLRPGIENLIQTAHEQGIATAIATATSRANVTALLHAAFGPDWETKFPIVVVGDEVPRKKPAPDVYLEALRQLQLRGDECLALEDSPAGLAAATSAGIPCVVTRAKFTPDEPMPEALACINGLGSASTPSAGNGPDGAFHGIADLSQLIAWHSKNGLN